MERVRQCPKLKRATEAILKAHSEGIQEGFTSTDKGPYQKHKAAILPAILPGGHVNTRNGKDKNRSITPSGFVGFDLDENTMEELRAFEKLVKSNRFKNIAFCARSVSGKLNGSLAVLMRVRFPASYQSAPKAILKRLGITRKTPWPEALQTINEAYHNAFTYLLKKKASINAGKAGKSIYNVRYLAHDPKAYHAPNAALFTLSMLDAVLAEMNTAGHVLKAGEVAVQIETDDALVYAEKYAEAKGYELRPGQRHHYFTQFAIACNLLGVPRQTVEHYAEQRIGKEVTSNCISYPYDSYQEAHGIWRHKLSTSTHQIIEGREGQKLSHIVTPEAILGKLLIAPTGSGKTWLIETIEGKKIIVCPTVALVENVKEEYPSAVPFTGSDRDVDAVRDAEFIATTYASFKRLAEVLDDKRGQFHVVVDEGHAFTSSTSAAYQLKQLTDVLTEGQTFKTFTIVTGTYLYNHHPVLRGMERIEVRIPQQKKTFEFVTATDVLKTAAQRIKASVAAGRFPLVLFNNKSEDGLLGTLKTLMDGTPGLRFFNANTKTDTEFQQIIKAGNIPEGITGLITTSVLKEGNNIYNQEDFDIIVVGAFHPSAIQQFSSRPRNAKSVHVAIIRSARREVATAGFDFRKTATWMEETNQQLCDELNTQDGLFTDQYRAEFKARQAVNNNPIFFDRGTLTYQVDFLALSYQAFNMERTAMNRNDSLMVAALESYGMTHQGITTDTTKQTAAEKQTAHQERQLAKEQKAAAYTEVLADLATEDAPLAIAESEMKSNAHNLTPAQRDVYGRFEQLAGICPNQTAILQQMEDTGPKKAGHDRLVKRLKIEAVRRDKAYMKSNRKFAIVLKAIHASFTPGQQLTSAEIAARVHAAFSLDSSLDLSHLEQQQRTDRYLKAARLFFDLRRKDRRNEAGKKVNAYEVCTLTFDELFKTDAKTRVQIAAIETADVVPF